MKITLAQINPTVGALDANLDLISRVWSKHNDTSDLIVFPELALTGYPPEDLLHNAQFIRDCEYSIEALVKESTNKKAAILVGAPHLNEGLLYNTAILIAAGKIIGQATKTHLPNYGVFDEKRYFATSQTITPIPYKDKQLGVMICEDMWYPNVSAELKEKGADILITLNASPFEIDKNETRLHQARERAKETGLPLIYVNQIGGQDDLIFDGASFALDEKGDLTALAKSFEEDIITQTSATEQPLPTEEQIFKAVTLGLKDYMRKTHQPRALIGLSGGVDSALVAAIAVKALGKDNVHAIMMPSRFTSQESLDDAAQCAKNLGISYEIVPITGMVEQFEKDQPDTSGVAHENLQSRLRGLILMTKSNMTGAMVTTTGNKSEMATGYATLYGDMCGGYNPLKDMYKTDVYKVCDWYNKTFDEKIPQNIIDKAPSAELRDNQKDQDSLPDYDTLDAILERLIEHDLSPAEITAEGYDKQTVERVARLLKIAQYKRHQSAPGAKITSRAFARERRYPMVNGY